MAPYAAKRQQNRSTFLVETVTTPPTSPRVPPTEVATSEKATLPSPRAKTPVDPNHTLLNSVLPPNVISSDEVPSATTQTQAPVDPNHAVLKIPFEFGKVDKSNTCRKQRTFHCRRRPSSLFRAAENVLILRQSAEKLYCRGDYQSSVQTFTKAIAMCTQRAGPTTESENSILPILVAHRATALFMLGAYAAAASEYQKILPDVSLGTEGSAESSTLCCTYHRFLFFLYACVGLARSCLKLGDHAAAQMTWEVALRAFDDASIFIANSNMPHLLGQHLEQARQLRAEASIGLVQAFHLKMFFSGQSLGIDLDVADPPHQHILCDHLDAVNLALSIAPCSEALLEQKLSMLAQMQRWAEVIGVCERVAARNVGLDHVFVGDLAAKCPFPGAYPATQLTQNCFFNLLEVDDATRKWQIQSPGAAAEAVLRLPLEAQRFFLRALRLENCCTLAEAALSALEQWVKQRQLAFVADESMLHYSSWLPMERSKFKRTQDLKRHANQLYVLKDFEQSLLVYKICLTIDADAVPSQLGGSYIGGRLHKRFAEAADVCNSVLKLYPRCMKSLLRRAKCYRRLNQMFNAVADYEQWLKLAQESKLLDNIPSAAFVLGEPYRIADDLIASIQKECESVKKKTDAVSVAAIAGDTCS
jgi:tetratricopeptide (TPR) repeat protein